MVNSSQEHFAVIKQEVVLVPQANIMRNRKRFVKEILDEKKGEKIVVGSVDGEVRVIPRYHAFYADPEAKDPKEWHMTLFPTNKRIVVYQANGWLKRDKYAQLPLSEIDEIAYFQVDEDNKNVCVTEFIAPDDSRFPSIVFKLDATGHPEDLEQYLVILKGISQLARVKITDYSME